MIDLTITLCTRNKANRLPGILERLQSQLMQAPIAWEILVVDNNSTDNTAKVVQDYQAKWSSSNPLRYCFESQLGFAFARQHAVTESRGEFVGFFDDDNLDTCYLTPGQEIFFTTPGGSLQQLIQLIWGKCKSQTLFNLNHKKSA